MKLKRMMAIVLCFAMVLSTMSFSVFAEDATVTVSSYDELVAALTNAETETIELAGDITIDTSITVPDGVILDLKGNTLYVNVENSYYNNVTIKNGNIVLGKDDVHVCDGYFLVNAGKTLVLNNVKVSSADGGIKGYAVFHLETGANLDLIDSTLNISDNEYAAGYIVYADESTATVDITGTTVIGQNVNGIVHATTVIDNSTFTIGDANEHGINRSTVTINDSTVTISGGTGRGITAQHGDLVISGDSVVNISDMGEATIELRGDKNLTVEESATVTVDVAVNNTTSGTISGKVTVEGDTPSQEPSATIVATVNGKEFTDIQEAIKYAAPSGTVTLLKDVTVDEWHMITETLTMSDDSLITVDEINGLTIDGNGYILTVNNIESAGNGGRLFYDATNLNVKDLTIKVADGLVGGIGLTSGEISNVTFIGGKYAVLPGAGGVTIEGCNFIDTTGYAIYFEDARPGIVVNGNTFNTASGAYSITMRDNEQFTNNTIVTGKVNLANSAKSTVTGNDFGDNRFKVYNNATATIKDNKINVLEFSADSEVRSTFGENTLSKEAKDVLDKATAPAGPVEVSTYEELIAELAKENANIILKNDITAAAIQSSGYGVAGIVVDAGDVLDGDGHKLTITGANTTWDCAVAMKGGEVKNLTIAGAMRGVFMPGANGDVVIDNCKFKDVIYTFNSDGGNKNYKVTIKNTVLNGWTSFSDVHGSVTFENCEFGEGSGYAFCRPYQATTFVDCDFAEGYKFDTTATADDTLTFIECTCADEPLGEDNGEMFIYGGKVIIDDENVKFVNPDNAVAKIGDKSFESLQEAIDAAKDGETVTLIDDIDIANEEVNTLAGKYNTYYKVEGKSITFNMNGKTISGTYNKDSMLVGVFATENNGHLILTGNGKIDITATKTVYSLLVNYDSTSTLTVEDGEYTVDKVSSSLVYSDKGSVEGLYGNTISGVTINGGTFTLGNIDNVNGPWIFNVGGSGDSYVSVNGGTFNFDIAHQKWADEVVVSKNCYVSDNGDGTWTVKDGAQVTLNETVLSGPYALRMDFGYPTFADAAAVAETDDVITLISDATGEASFDDIRNLTVDLNGYTLNGAILPSKGDITVKNGSIVNENRGVSAIELNEGKLSLENVNISSARHGVRIDGAVETVIDGGKYTLTATSGTRHAVNVSGAANVTIKDGTFIGPKGTSMDSGSAVCVQSGATVTIEGGNFSGGKRNTLGVSGTMTIYGGTFDQDPSKYVAVGYAAKANDDGTYGIVSVKPDAYTVTAVASQTEVRYNNGNPDSFTVKYIATGGDVIGAMAQLEYDNTLFVCAEDSDGDGVIKMNNNRLTTDANGETLIRELNFTVKVNPATTTTYKFIAKHVQVVSDYDAAGSGTQDGFVENLVGADVTVVAQYDVTLPTDGSLAGNTYVDVNTDYSATINNFDENMTYTITYTMGGVEGTVTVTKDNVVNGGFVIEDVNGDIVFTSVTSKLNCEIVLLPEALTGYTLVMVKDGVSAGYTYNGAEMYAIDRYVGLTAIADNEDREEFVGDILGAESVRAILIAGAVTEAEARAAIEVSTTASTNLEKSFDVNGNGQLYFNDAMTAHGCYGKQYDTALKMIWYLRSDVNTDFMIDTGDYDDTVEAVWASIN